MPCPCCNPPNPCCGTCRQDSDCPAGCRCCCCGPGSLPRCVKDNGSCEPPDTPGACCLPGGGCVDGVSQTECETCGNTFCILTITLPSGEACPPTGPGGSVWVKCGNQCEAVVQSNGGCGECDDYEGQEVSLPNGGTAFITARCEEEVGRCGEWYAGQTCAGGACGGACCFPEMEACIEFAGSCNEGDPPCPEGFTCIGEVCEKMKTVPVGECQPPDAYSAPIAPYCQDGLTQSACEEQGGTFYPGKTCAEEPCQPCFEQPLLGTEADVDSWCEAAASIEDFVGGECLFTTATCGERTLVADYGDGIGDWLVTVCCDNPLP